MAMPRLLRRALGAAAVLAVALTLAPALPAPPAAAAPTSLDQVRRFAVPASTLQVVLVRSTSWSSSYATVEFFQRTAAGAPWVAALPAQSGRVGSRGMHDAATRLQSTGTTPAGIFSLPSAFGGAADPGTALPYRRFDGNDWWPYDPQDPATYNVYQTSRPSTARWRTTWAERLADYYQGSNRQYAHAVVLDYNLPAPYRPADTRKGGGIFLHVNGSGATAGCISISEPAMVAALRWLDPAANPTLVAGPTTWLDDAATTTAGLRTVAAPTPFRPAGTTTGFTAVAQPARLQWWRLTVANACTGTAVATSSGQGAAPVAVRWNATVAGAAAPPGLYRMRLEAGTATWTPQAALTWTVEVFASGTSTLAGCPAQRVAGGDRYATAVAVARQAAPAARTVVLAGGEDRHLIDGLVAGPLAASRDAALLLTARATLPAATAAEITRRGADTVFVVGSQGAVSDDVVAALRALGVTQVRRFGGASRYETAALVAAEVGAPDGAALVASGADASLVDGLAASGPAVRLHRPILLTAPGALPDATAEALVSLGVTRTHVVGGPGAVSDAVLDGLPGAVRLGGASRFDTAAAVATAFAPAVGSADVVLAAGVGPLVDALPAGTLGRLVLLTGTVLPAATSTWLGGNGTARLTAVGGPGATTPGAVAAAIEATDPA